MLSACPPSKYPLKQREFQRCINVTDVVLQQYDALIQSSVLGEFCLPTARHNIAHADNDNINCTYHMLIMAITHFRLL